MSFERYVKNRNQTMGKYFIISLEKKFISIFFFMQAKDTG